MAVSHAFEDSRFLIVSGWMRLSQQLHLKAIILFSLWHCNNAKRIKQKCTWRTWSLKSTRHTNCTPELGYHDFIQKLNVVGVVFFFGWVISYASSLMQTSAAALFLRAAVRDLYAHLAQPAHRDVILGDAQGAESLRRHLEARGLPRWVTLLMMRFPLSHLVWLVAVALQAFICLWKGHTAVAEGTSVFITAALKRTCHFKSGWTGLWATLSSCRCLCSLKVSWTGWPFMVPFNSILWFYDYPFPRHAFLLLLSLRPQKLSYSVMSQFKVTTKLKKGKSGKKINIITHTR